jgi:hypothetical protein
MITKVKCPKNKKEYDGEIAENTLQVIDGQMTLLARCYNCRDLHAKVMPLETFKAERQKEGI